MYAHRPASRALLSEMGTKVDNDEALWYYEKAGCHVDKANNIVRVPDYVINETLAACSSWSDFMTDAAASRCLSVVTIPIMVR